MRAAWIAVSLAVVMLATGPARADEWRFCLAAAHAQHKVFLSGTFVTAADMDTLQSDFARELERRGITHDEVQCPRGHDRDAATEMQLNAIGFNRELGNAVVRLDWRPVR